MCKKNSLGLASLVWAAWLVMFIQNGAGQSATAGRRVHFYRGTPANPKIQAMVDSVSAQRIRADLEKLVSFETRHTNSDTVSESRGIGAARRWIKSRFQAASTATGGALRPEFFYFNANVCGIAGLHANVMATLTGAQSESRDRLFIVSGHMDNRTFDGCDAASFAPGTNDDGSGTVASLELARVMSKFQFDATLIFMTVTGEDEGLFGSIAYANYARANNLRIEGMLTNDVVGNIIGPDGNVDSTSVRHFSLGPSNSPSRQLARYFKLKGEQYVPGMTVNLIPAQDRPGRGGDHIPFNDNGYAAVRFTEPAERLEHQHSNTDILANMSPTYTAQVTRLSLAGLASLAFAPATPTAPLTVHEVGNGTDLLLSWTRSNTESDFAGYRVAWHHPDSLFYQGIVPVSNVTEFTLSGLTPGQPVYLSYSALDGEGNESVFSIEVLATPQVAPKAPQNLAATSTPTEIRLAWQPNTELDLAGYLMTRFGPGASSQSFTLDAARNSFIDQTAQPHVLYRYSLRTRDRDGNESPAAASVRGQLATHDGGLLILDATKDSPSRPLQPSDDEVDSFYQRLLQSFELAAQWDVADSALQQLAISDADMGVYSTVIVHSEVSPPAHALAQDTLSLKKYVQNGGRLLVVGWGLIDNISGRAELSKNFQPGDFVYDFLRVAGARTGTGADRDFKGADAVAANYPAVTVDAAKVPLFGNNLIAMEVLSSFAAGTPTETLYLYRSSAQPPSVFHGQSVGLRHLQGNLRVIVLDFPLYFLPEATAAQVIRQALIDLGETPTAVQDGPGPGQTPTSFDLGQSYPNPLRPSAASLEIRIQYQLPVRAQVKVAVYNLTGQLVTTLVEAHRPPGFHSVLWDGKDSFGRNVSSGVYFYRLETQEVVKVKKMVLVR